MGSHWKVFRLRERWPDICLVRMLLGARAEFRSSVRRLLLWSRWEMKVAVEVVGGKLMIDVFWNLCWRIGCEVWKRRVTDIPRQHTVPIFTQWPYFQMLFMNGVPLVAVLTSVVHHKVYFLENLSLMVPIMVYLTLPQNNWSTFCLLLTWPSRSRCFLFLDVI